MINRAGLGVAFALTAAAMYGLVPNFTRAAINNGVPAVDSIFLRTSLIVVVFAIIAVLRNESLAIPREARMAFAAQSLATGGVGIGYMASVQFIPVGLAAMIFYTYPVIILLVATQVERKAPGLAKISIAIFAFAGLAVAIAPSIFGGLGAAGESHLLDWRGLALAMLAALSATLQFFSGPWISNYMNPIVFGCRVHMAVWPMILLLALYFGSGKMQFFPGGDVAPAGYWFLLAIAVLYVFSYFAQMMSLRYAPASTVAPFFNLEPVVATVVAGLLLDERLSWNQYAGGAMVLAALVASSFLDRFQNIAEQRKKSQPVSARRAARKAARA